MWEAEPNGDAKTVYFLMVIAFIILIIAWVNYINLSTVKAIFRSREVAVRKISGALRIQLIKQFLIESFAINIIATVFALILVVVTMPYFRVLTGRTMSLNTSGGMDGIHCNDSDWSDCIRDLSCTCNIILQTHDIFRGKLNGGSGGAYIQKGTCCIPIRSIYCPYCRYTYRLQAAYFYAQPESGC